MTKFVRHKPNYTPEKAAARRLAREIARKLGIPPRKLNRKYRNPLFSSAKFAMEMLFAQMRQSLKLPYDEFAKQAGFASGGVIAPPYQRPIIDFLTYEHRIPLSIYQPLPKVEPREGEPVTVKMSTVTEIKLTNLPDLPPEQAERMEKVGKILAKQIDDYWKRQGEALTRGGHLPEGPPRYVDIKVDSVS
jgi:hypothetical protein